MAIDSQAKRHSLIGLALPAPMLMAPPSGTVDNTARAILVRVYSAFGTLRLPNIEMALHSHLVGFAGLYALVGGRVYRHQLPISSTLPALTFVRIATQPTQHRGNARGGLLAPRFQVSAWATNHGGARAAAAQVRAALGAFTQAANPRVDVALLQDDARVFEEEPGRFRAVLNVDIWHSAA